MRETLYNVCGTALLMAGLTAFLIGLGRVLEALGLVH